MPQNYHPTTRVLAVLELLQNHGRLSGAELATRLEVDRRSLRRYIVKLEEIGIPIMAERGPHGGYSLMPGFKLPPMMFSDDEALALSIGLIAARGLGLSDASPAIASAQAKLERIMPSGLQQKARALNERVRLDLKSASNAIDNAILMRLSSAAMAQQAVHLLYRDVNQVGSQRDFDPYGLAFHASSWYVTGMCHLRNDIRSFRLDRVQSVQTLQQHFTRPSTFDVLSHLSKSVATIPRTYAAEVLLKTDMQTARAHVFDALGLLSITEEGIVLHNQSDDLAWLARQLASLPFDFEIHKPAQLHQELTKLAQRLLGHAGSA